MKDESPKTTDRALARRRWRTAARVGDAAVTTLGDVLRLVLRFGISALLILLIAGLLFSCIFAYYVKNSLTTDLNISLSDYSLSLSSTVWAYAADGSLSELAVLQTDENRIWVDYEDIP